MAAAGSAHVLPNLRTGLAFGSSDPAKATPAMLLAPGSRAEETRASRSGPRRGTDYVPRHAAGVRVDQQPAQDVWQLPVHENYAISSGFGLRWGVLHPGTDLAVPAGTPVYAANAGTVTLCRWNGGYGNNVMIQHEDGVTSVYGHASRLLCHDGEQVSAGDEIALSGDTGYSTGPHLHFELRRGDKPFDPLPFMHAHGADLPAHADTVTGGLLQASD